jgi:hypothetical protein
LRKGAAGLSARDKALAAKTDIDSECRKERDPFFPSGNWMRAEESTAHCRRRIRPIKNQSFEQEGQNI